MKVKYIGKGSLKSRGHRFESGEVYALLEDTFNYMTRTFGKLFEVIEEPKEVEPEVEEEKLKPKRKSRVKKVVAPKE